LKKPRSGGRPPVISREKILAAARSLPLDALTMPLVASKLGVNAAALYYHFESRGALMAALSSLIVADFDVAPVDPRRWRVWLERTTVDLCRFLVANPVVFEIENMTDVVKTIAPALENVLKGMGEAGFELTESLQMWSVIGPFVFTQARALHDAWRLDAKTKQQMLNTYETYLQQLGELRSAAAKLNLQDPEQAFVKNLRWLISLLPEPRSAAPRATRRKG
jgi:AcrR family transcriptional regulator